MPPTCRLRYVGALPTLVAPVGREVQPDQIVEFIGQVVDPEEHEPDDAIYTVMGNPPRVVAWPLSQWRDETPARKQQPKE